MTPSLVEGHHQGQAQQDSIAKGLQLPPSDPLFGRSREFNEFVRRSLSQSLHYRMNEKISDKDAMKIANAMTEWEINLAVVLDLTRQEIADLNNEKRPQIQRQDIV